MTKISSMLTLSRSLRTWTVLLGALCALAAAAGPAQAEFGIQPDPLNPAQADFHSDIVQSDGVTPETQAGGHPYQIITSFNFNRTPDTLFPDERVKDIVVDLPTGFAGDPTAAPTCAFVKLRDSVQCPTDSQVGLTQIRFLLGFGVDFSGTIPVYNMDPMPGDVATFAFNILNIVTPVHIRVRSDGDYGVEAVVHNPSSALPLSGSTLTLWGVPADASHDPLRGSCLQQDGSSSGSCPANMPPRPFLTSQVDCSAAPGVTTLSIDSYEHPTVIKSYPVTAPAGIDGCEKLSFNPSLTFRPASQQAGAPTGATVHLHIPQNSVVTGVGTPPLRKAVVKLPLGVAISPSSVDGLGACTDAQLGKAVLGAAQCPASSQIGTVRIDTPLLPDPLLGRIYLGTQQPDQTFRIFLVAEGSGVRVKLNGNVDTDPITGQITTTFDDNPQLPFSDLDLTFNGGEHAPLVNPRACGSYTTTSSLTPWSAPTTSVATPSDTFQITQGVDGVSCAAAGFKPGFVAGTVSPSAGKSSAFTLTFTRGDGDQFLKGVSVHMPQGLLARLASVPVLCADKQAASGTCDEGSRVGSVTTGAGPGTDPFFLPGRAYLTGPYNHGPFGLSIVVPAVAGPFNLGTVVVRAAIKIDRRTSEITVESDPLPPILMGVPLQVRTVNVTVDRPDFMINPTDCSVKSIDGTITSVDNQSAAVSSRFQVGDCASLPFKPRMSFSVGGKGHTKAGLSTPLTAMVRMSPGQANLAGVRVALPLTLNALLPVVQNACTEAEFEAGKCESARVGSAVAVTPLLRDPLRGSVYFVKHGKGLPNLFVALRGQVDFDLVGKVIIPRDNRLVTDFNAVPDVPITKFALRLVSGKHGPVGIAEDLCAPKNRRAPAQMTFRAQSGKVVQVSKPLQIAGCAKAKAKGGAAKGA